MASTKAKALQATFVTLVTDEGDMEQLRSLFEQVAGVLARTGMLGMLQFKETDAPDEINEALDTVMRGPPANMPEPGGMN